MSEHLKALDEVLIAMDQRTLSCDYNPVKRAEFESWVQQVTAASGVPLYGLPIQDYAQQVADLSEQRDRLERQIAELDAYARALDARTGNHAASGLNPPTDRLVLADEALLYGAVVYALVDPRDPERFRYIGQSTNPVARYLTHMSYPSDKVGAWTRELRAEGYVPAMLLIETVDEVGLLDARELQWIRSRREVGQADLNQMIRRRA